MSEWNRGRVTVAVSLRKLRVLPWVVTGSVKGIQKEGARIVQHGRVGLRALDLQFPTFVIVKTRAGGVRTLALSALADEGELFE